MSDLVIGQRVLGFDLPTETLAWTELHAVHRFGPSLLTEYAGARSNMAVTPEHRCIVRQLVGRARRPELGVRPANRLTDRSAILTAANMPSGEEQLSDEFVRILAWFVAEGWFQPKRRSAWICQSMTANPRYVDELDALLAPWVRGRYIERGSLVKWHLSAVLADQFRDWVPGKKLDRLWTALSPRHARLFLYEFVRADGHWAGVKPIPPPPKLDDRRNFWHCRVSSSPNITQKDKATIDLLQAIAVIGGLRTSLHKHSNASGGHTWDLFLLAGRGDYWSLGSQVQRRVFEAPTWCPMTGLGTWVARRRNSVFITGNSGVPDALAYGLAVLYPAADWLRATLKRPVPAPRRRSWLGG